MLTIETVGSKNVHMAGIHASGGGFEGVFRRGRLRCYRDRDSGDADCQGGDFT